MHPTRVSHPDLKAITLFLASTATPERGGLPYLDGVLPGEAVLGGQDAVEVRQAAPFRRCSRSEEEGDRLQVRVADSRRVHGGQTAANASGSRGSRMRGM